MQEHTCMYAHMHVCMHALTSITLLGMGYTTPSLTLKFLWSYTNSKRVTQLLHAESAHDSTSLTPCAQLPAATPDGHGG